MKLRDIPGTFADDFVEPTIRTLPTPSSGPDVRGWRVWSMGECLVHRFIDEDGLQLVVSHGSRYPSWDEVKFARYRLLPPERTFALLLPPAAEYHDDPRNPHVFQLTEVEGAE